MVKIYDFTKLYNIQMDSLKFASLWWDKTNNVLNGIAYRKSTGNFLITGKNYNYMFEVSLH